MNDKDDGTYLFKTAGIRERHGRVPIWLVLVIIALIVWGAYYMVVYW